MKPESIDDVLEDAILGDETKRIMDRLGSYNLAQGNECLCKTSKPINLSPEARERLQKILADKPKIRYCRICGCELPTP